MIDLSPELQAVFPDETAFDDVLALRGTVWREHKNRRTLEVVLGGARYFVKIHGPTGWYEIVKNLTSSLNLPVLSALPEVRAVRHLERIGIPSVRAVGYGRRGRNPARRESFIITEALEGMIDLEALAASGGGLHGAARARLRRAIVDDLAAIARTMHTGGIYHRDFYLVHFLLPERDWSAWRPGEALAMHVIDLHRARIRARLPRRWVVKDLAALLFSAMDHDLTDRDLLRFWRGYRGAGWRSTWSRDAGFLRRVRRRAVKLYQRVHETPTPRPGSPPSCAGSAPDPSPAVEGMS